MCNSEEITFGFVEWVCLRPTRLRRRHHSFMVVGISFIILDLWC